MNALYSLTCTLRKFVSFIKLIVSDSQKCNLELVFALVWSSGDLCDSNKEIIYHIYPCSYDVMMKAKLEQMSWETMYL